MSKRHVYLYEGETERRLIDCLARNQVIKSGQKRKFNLWDAQNLNDLKRILPPAKSLVIFIVFDCDRLENMNRFTSNLKGLVTRSSRVVLLAQHDNLEDEMTYACSKSNNAALYSDFFNVSSKTQFKTRFAQSSNLYRKLNQNNFSAPMLWSRQGVYSSRIGTINGTKLVRGIEYCLLN